MSTHTQRRTTIPLDSLPTMAVGVGARMEDVTRFLRTQTLSDALASNLSGHGNVLAEESWRAWTPSARQPLRLHGAEHARCTGPRAGMSHVYLIS